MVLATGHGLVTGNKHSVKTCKANPIAEAASTLYNSKGTKDPQPLHPEADRQEGLPECVATIGIYQSKHCKQHLVTNLEVI